MVHESCRPYKHNLDARPDFVVALAGQLSARPRLPAPAAKSAGSAISALTQLLFLHKLISQALSL